MTELVILWAFLLMFVYLFGVYFRMLWLMAEYRVLYRAFNPDEVVDILQQSLGWPIWLVMIPVLKFISKYWDGRL